VPLSLNGTLLQSATVAHPPALGTHFQGIIPLFENRPPHVSLDGHHFTAYSQRTRDNVRLARLRRKLSATQVAERAGMGRTTLTKIEQGHPGVGMGQIINVLKVLGLEEDLLLVAKDDVLGRKLQDAKLETGRRAPKKSRPS